METQPSPSFLLDLPANEEAAVARFADAAKAAIAAFRASLMPVPLQGSAFTDFIRIAETWVAAIGNVAYPGSVFGFRRVGAPLRVLVQEANACYAPQFEKQYGDLIVLARDREVLWFILPVLRQLRGQIARLEELNSVPGTSEVVASINCNDRIKELLAELRQHTPLLEVVRTHPLQRKDTTLPPALKAVWDALDGKAMTAKELATKVGGPKMKEQAIRTRVARLRKLGWKIDHSPGEGHYRPDAPPR